MKQRIKLLLLALMTVGTVFAATGCGSEETPYVTNDEENYTVSVKYDANGGIFTTNTSVIVDSYNISEMDVNGSGKVEIPLITPDHASRGNDAFSAVKNGYFLAGWYAQRTESVDAQGNVVYTYGERWDFDKDVLEVAANGEYSSSEPVLTLYAAWVPLFEIEIYSLQTGEYIDSLTYDPTIVSEIKVPVWNEETGAVEMYKFPEYTGYTFNGAYYDAEGTKAVDTENLVLAGEVDYATGTAVNAVMPVYVDWLEGEWFHIYNVEQFIDNATSNGNYEIHADLDFTDEVWPTALMYGNFTGTINGNGHTFKNIEVIQTNNSKVNVGLFGVIAESASISDLTFENATVIIQAGTRVTGTSYGLFAGTISEAATISNVAILGSHLQIDSACYFGVDDYIIGLVCGMGDSSVLTQAEITCEAVGDNPESISITVEGNTVTLEFIEE